MQENKMTNEIILKKAIEKASKNGCENLPFGISWVDYNEYFELEEWAKVLIFSHNFAKAFWGKEMTVSWPMLKRVSERISGYEERIIPLWQFHLQQMVLEKEPLKYLEKFL